MQPWKFVPPYHLIDIGHRQRNHASRVIERWIEIEVQPIQIIKFDDTLRAEKIPPG
jgi:hypothetical protein